MQTVIPQQLNIKSLPWWVYWGILLPQNGRLTPRHHSWLKGYPQLWTESLEIHQDFWDKGGHLSQSKAPTGEPMNEMTAQKLQDNHKLLLGKSKITISSDISSVTRYPWHFSDLPSQYSTLWVYKIHELKMSRSKNKRLTVFINKLNTTSRIELVEQELYWQNTIL